MVNKEFRAQGKILSLKKIKQGENHLKPDTQKIYLKERCQQRIGQIDLSGDENTFLWEAPYATDYEIEWVENSTGDCKGINNYVGSKRVTVSSEDIQTQEDRETEKTKEMIDTIGSIIAGTLSLTLLYSIYRFVKK